MSRKSWVFFSVIFDLVAVNLAIVAAFYLRFLGTPPDFNFSAYTKLAVFITAIYLVSAYLSSVYVVDELLSTSFFEPVFKAVTICWLILGAFIWLYRAFTFPRLVFAFGWLFAVLLIYSWRFLSLKVSKTQWPKQKILILGTKPIARDIIDKLAHHMSWGYELVGVVSDTGQNKFCEVDIVGKSEDLPKLVKKLSVDRIIITDPLKAATIEQLAELGLQNLKIEVVPDLYEILVGRVDYNTLTDIPLLELTSINNKFSYQFLKRFLDIFFSGLGLLIFTPLVILPAAIIIKVTSKGPVFYIQDRIGLQGRVFRIIKLRTMHTNAELLSGPVLAEKNDTRITRMGSLLRKYRFDELPQLINIFKGEMSFVGPRPERPEFVKKYRKEIPGYNSRFKLKPGATGLAQISGSYATSVANKLKFDLFYLYHRSLLLDIKIILKTIRVMVSGTGSH